MPFKKIGQISTYYEIKGDGEPLIFINGICGTYLDWKAAVDILSKNFKCITFDNRGIGKTSRVLTPFSTLQMATDTANLIVELGITNANVVGLSMGGLVAQELSINFSNLVKRLILASTWAKPDRLLKDHFLFEIRLAEQIGIEVAKDDAILWSFCSKYYENNQELQDAGRKTLVVGDLTPNDFIYQANACINHNTYDRLSEISVPTLILVGKEDILTPRRFSDVLNDGIPNSKIIIVPGGHAFPIENPSFFAEKIHRFVSNS